jgi:hypothetical protein
MNEPPAGGHVTLRTKDTMYTIRILSVNEYKEVEWKEVIESPTKNGARRKANALVRSCDVEAERIDKRQIDTTYEYWTL